MSEETNTVNRVSENTPSPEQEVKPTFAIRQPGQNRGQGGRSSFNRGGRNQGQRGDRRGPGGPGKKGNRDNRRPKDEEASNLETQIIQVRRVTRVVKGGKRMRFSALVVVGDKAGRVGFGLKKGLDFQDAVAKATKKAQENMLRISISKEGSIDFPSQLKFKSCEIMLKPAKTGTGLIAGGFLRPVLELAGIENVYSKIIRSRNKVVGVQTAFEALKQYKSTKSVAVA